MKRNAIFLSLIAAAALLASCVKEDRAACPCLVRFDIGNMFVPEGMEEGVVDLYVYASDGSLVLNEMRRWREGLVIDETLPKDTYTVAAYFSQDGIFANVTQDRYVVDWGYQGPVLYGNSSLRDAHCDYLYVCPKVTKQYSKITIYNIGSIEMAQMMSFEGLTVYVDSPYGAYELPTVKASHNDLHFLLNPESDEFSFLLPRQTNQGDKKLSLIFRDKSITIAELELWRYLEAAGYPWDADDLPDVRIGVNFKTASVHIKVQGWEEEFVTSLM